MEPINQRLECLLSIRRWESTLMLMRLRLEGNLWLQLGTRWSTLTMGFLTSIDGETKTSQKPIFKRRLWKMHLEHLMWMVVNSCIYSRPMTTRLGLSKETCATIWVWLRTATRFHPSLIKAIWKRELTKFGSKIKIALSCSSKRSSMRNGKPLLLNESNNHNLKFL